MFWIPKVVPCFREFIKVELEREWILSDCDLMDIYGRKYCKWYSPSAMAKKLESLRKKIWELNKKDNLIQETNRIKIPLKVKSWRLETHEIFFKLR